MTMECGTLVGYTAHPIGCAVANKILNIIQRLVGGESWLDAQRRWVSVNKNRKDSTVWTLWDLSFVFTFSSMTLGTALAVKFKDDNGGKLHIYTVSSTYSQMPQAMPPNLHRCC